MSNKVSEEKQSTGLRVQADIKGLNFTINQEQVGGPNNMYDYIEELEVLTIVTTVKSVGDLIYNYDFGDGRNVTTRNSSIR